jgi:hypothetical protein
MPVGVSNQELDFRNKKRLSVFHSRGILKTNSIIFDNKLNQKLSF